MRVLVTGAGGQIGREVVTAFADHDVIAATHAALDVGERDAVLGAIASAVPDAVVHAAAWTAVDACEADADRAFRVNVLGTRNVSEAARRVGAHLCYLSTDYVFDGTKPEPYVEWDEPNPLSVYGRSKLAGERELDADATVVRTSWVSGFHGHNMVKTILRLAGERDSLAFVDDQRGNPSFADDLATMIRRLVAERRPGLYHVTNQGSASWPITTAELEPRRPAPRPANSVLDNAALRLSGVPLLAHYHDSLERLLRKLGS
jgi:dTDP-4-dehydrorhamnose reductase